MLSNICINNETLASGITNELHDSHTSTISGEVVALDPHDKVSYITISLNENGKPPFITKDFLLTDANNQFSYTPDSFMGFGLFDSNLTLKISFRTAFGYSFAESYPLHYSNENT